MKIVPLMKFLKLTLPKEALERYSNYGKPIRKMDDFNNNPLTNETCNLSKDILISLQSNSCVPIIKTEKATAIFVPIAIPWVCWKCFPLQGNEFSFNISFIRFPRVGVGIGGLG